MAALLPQDLILEVLLRSRPWGWYWAFKLCLIMAFPNTGANQSVPPNRVPGRSIPLALRQEKFQLCFMMLHAHRTRGCRVSLSLGTSSLASAEGIFTRVESKKNSIPSHTLFTMWFQETAPLWWKVPAIMHPEVLVFKLFQWTRRVLLTELYSPGHSLPSARIQTQRIDFSFFFLNWAGSSLCKKRLFWHSLDRKQR